MRAYGAPRHTDFADPDCVDTLVYGRKSSAANLPGKGGDIRSPIKAKNRRRARLRLKKAERSRAKSEVSAEIEIAPDLT